MKPYLALQYPDPMLGRGVIVATTRDEDALRLFKSAVLDEARSRYKAASDEVVMLIDRLELERLERLLCLLVPEIPASDS